MHLGQFACIAIFLGGWFALSFALDLQTETARWTGRFGAALAVATLALYGAVLQWTGSTLKQAVNAWASAPDAQEAVRFASAEAIRWLEWGMRTYQNFVLGLVLLLFVAAVARTAWVPRPIAKPATSTSGLPTRRKIVSNEGGRLRRSAAVDLPPWPDN